MTNDFVTIRASDPFWDKEVLVAKRRVPSQDVAALADRLEAWADHERKERDSIRGGDERKAARLLRAPSQDRVTDEMVLRARDYLEQKCGVLVAKSYLEGALEAALSVAPKERKPEK